MKNFIYANAHCSLQITMQEHPVKKASISARLPLWPGIWQTDIELRFVSSSELNGRLSIRDWVSINDLNCPRLVIFKY